MEQGILNETRKFEFEDLMLDLSYYSQVERSLKSNSLESIYNMIESNTDDSLPTVIAYNDKVTKCHLVAMIPILGNSTVIWKYSCLREMHLSISRVHEFIEISAQYCIEWFQCTNLSHMIRRGMNFWKREPIKNISYVS